VFKKAIVFFKEEEKKYFTSSQFTLEYTIFPQASEHPPATLALPSLDVGIVYPMLITLVENCYNLNVTTLFLPSLAFHSIHSWSASPRRLKASATDIHLLAVSVCVRESVLPQNAESHKRDLWST